MIFQSRTAQMSIWMTTTLVACTLLLAGCNQSQTPEYDKLGLVEISGTVTLDGQPLADTTVRFEESPFLYSFGVTDSNGYYRLMFDSRKSGIMPGEKTVRFIPGKPPSESGQAKSGKKENEEGDPDEKPKVAANTGLPEAYNSKSSIKVAVTDSDSHFDFDLKSDGSTRSRK